jgi:hypothetical protein
MSTQVPASETILYSDCLRSVCKRNIDGRRYCALSVLYYTMYLFVETVAGSGTVNIAE